MTLNVREISLLFIAFQSLMFGLILFSGKGPKRQANYLLAALLFVLGVQMITLLSEERWLSTDQVQPYLCLFGFAYGPLLFLYTKSLIYDQFKLERKSLIHSVPFLIMLASALLGYGLCAKFGSLLYISLIAYSAAAIKSIIGYRAVVKQTQSSTFQINLSWLQWVLIAFTATFFIDIYEHFYHDIDVIPGLSLVNVSLLILVNGMFYRGLRQPMIFQGITREDEIVTASTEAIGDETWPEEELVKLQDYMERQMPYRNASLTLNQLAEELELSPRRLSNLVNRHFKKNFVDFINTYRIDLAMERLQRPKDPKETILEVMYEVGFNSKSSFNTLFKQKTGKTPSDFKNQRQ